MGEVENDIKGNEKRKRNIKKERSPPLPKFFSTNGRGF